MVSGGHVSLVGAGPGDPGLLTLKALKRIQQADLIVYDYLTNPKHLEHASKKAKIIGVGRGFRHKKISQQKINDLILKHARAGHRVVRLKGGDPFLFGRGGEEALFLEMHRVPFDIVPGVTSAVACAAYTGIPMTHRDHNASVTFLTGHRANDKALDTIDWNKIVSLDGTIAIYMGLYNLPHITHHLIQAGLSKQTPVAVIEWGTLTRQRSCIASLHDIARQVSLKKLSAPAMIIVGDVVNLSKKLNWFESLPLFGQTVVVTRMKDKSSELIERLEDMGAQTLSMPVIEIKPVKNYSGLDATISDLSRFDWLVFTSAYGVDAFFGRLAQKNKDARALGSLKIAAVGTETGKALKDRRISVDLMPRDYQSSSLAHDLGRVIQKTGSHRVLLARTDIAPPQFERILGTYGAKITDLIVYRTVRPSVSVSLRRQVLSSKADWVTFTSSSSASNFVKILGSSAVKKLAKRTRFASIGPVTSKTLKSLGIKVSAEAQTYNLDGLVTALAKKVSR